MCVVLLLLMTFFSAQSRDAFLTWVCWICLLNLTRGWSCFNLCTLLSWTERCSHFAIGISVFSLEHWVGISPLFTIFFFFFFRLILSSLTQNEKLFWHHWISLYLSRWEPIFFLQCSKQNPPVENSSFRNWSPNRKFRNFKFAFLCNKLYCWETICPLIYNHRWLQNRIQCSNEQIF